MPTRHVVKQGESLPEIARRYGFTDHRVVWDAPANADLRRKRSNINVLQPGDVVTVPDPAPKTTSARTGQQSSFTVSCTERVLRLVLKDHYQKPLANEPFTLRFKSAPAVSKSTDGGGKIEEPVPPASTDAYLDVAGRTYHLRFGRLNPMDQIPGRDVSGVQARLKNLGYYSRATSGVLDRATRVAIGLFQKDFGLQVDEKVSGALVSKLEQEHGS